MACYCVLLPLEVKRVQLAADICTAAFNLVTMVQCDTPEHSCIVVMVHVS